MKRVFIIGPGGVGKTTCGKAFANLIGYTFVDLDSEFMGRIGHIGEHIEKKGYLSYCRSNSALFYALIEEQSSDTVFALSSGFLAHEETCPELSKHKDAIRDLGVSILLLPSRSASETEEIVVARQLSRGIGCREASQRRIIRNRFPRYLGHGNIHIFSAERPMHVAEEMKTKYLEYAEQQPERDRLKLAR
jgi:shikimate kinase